MKKIHSLFGIAWLCFSSAVYSQSNTISYYVDANNGKDSNDGTTIATSFKSITKAKETVRKLDKYKGGDITIYLRGGIYVLDKTIVYNEKDGGTDNCKVIYRNYDDEVPVISGGEQISGWELFDKTKNIYRASAGNLTFRQLYVNGIRAIRAKNPNNTSTDKDRFHVVRWDEKKKIVTINKTEIANWENLTRVEFCTMSHFTGNHLRIASFTTDASNAYLIFRTPEIDLINGVEENFRTSGYPHGPVGYWFENAYELIDMEGEWYLNTTDHYVYYKPRSGGIMSDAVVIAPKLETLVSVEGTNFDTPVRNLQFYGIKFMHSAWLRPDSNGCVEYQAFHPFSNTQDSVTSCNSFTAPAGVYVAKADYIRFERCTFSHMGANALNLHYGTHNCTIVGNVVYDISGNGINEARQNVDNVGWVPAYIPLDSREICKNDTISNNYITNCGADYIGSVGIFCGMTKNVVIIHNEVGKLPYTGISVGWGWTSASGMPTVMRGNKINNNYIHDILLIANDGGGIYTLSTQPGSNCDYNYILNTTQTGRYHDEGTAGYTFNSNIVENIGKNWYRINQGKDITADNNYTNSSKVSIQGTNCPAPSNTHYYEKANWPKEALDIIKNAGLETKYKDIKGNLEKTEGKIIK